MNFMKKLNFILCICLFIGVGCLGNGGGDSPSAPSGDGSQSNKIASLGIKFSDDATADPFTYYPDKNWRTFQFGDTVTVTVVAKDKNKNLINDTSEIVLKVSNQEMLKTIGYCKFVIVGVGDTGIEANASFNQVISSYGLRIHVDPLLKDSYTVTVNDSTLSSPHVFTVDKKKITARASNVGSVFFTMNSEPDSYYGIYKYCYTETRNVIIKNGLVEKAYGTTYQASDHVNYLCTWEAK